MNRRGQAVIEMSMVIAIVCGALLGMQIYIKRGISGRLREAADSVGEQFSAKTAEGNVVSSTKSRTHTDTQLNTSNHQLTTTVTYGVGAPEETKRIGTEKVGKLEASLW